MLHEVGSITIPYQLLLAPLTIATLPLWLGRAVENLRQGFYNMLPDPCWLLHNYAVVLSVHPFYIPDYIIQSYLYITSGSDYIY